MTPRRSDVPTVRTKRKSNVKAFVFLFGGVLLLIALIVGWVTLGTQTRIRSHVMSLATKARGSSDPAAVFGAKDPESVAAAKAIGEGDAFDLPLASGDSGNYADNPARSSVCLKGTIHAKGGRTIPVAILGTAEGFTAGDAAVAKMSLSSICSCRSARRDNGQVRSGVIICGFF